MDIQKIISDIAEKISGNDSLIKSFTSDPIKAVKDLLGLDISADQIGEIVSGVTKMLGQNAADTAKGGLFDKIKGALGL